MDGADESSSIVPAETPPLSKWKKGVVFASLLAMNFFGFASLSVISPFFPAEARRKGVSETVIGLIFSSYGVVMLIFYPIWGHVLFRARPKWFLVAGGIVCGSASIVFGQLSSIQDTASFTAACFLTRVVEAMGFAALHTGTFAEVGRLYPENLGSAMSLVEIFIGTGMGFGPAIGSALFSVGGYHLPFSTLGGMRILVAANVYFLISCIPGANGDLSPNKKSAEASGLTPWKLFGLGTTQLTMLMVAGCSFGYTCYMPVLALHLHEQLGVDETNSGYYFASELIAYAVMAPVAGKLSDCSRPEHRIPMMGFGLVLCGSGLLLLGPSTIFQLFGAHVAGSSITNLVACVLIGSGEAVVIMPSYQVLIDGLKDAGHDDLSSAHGIVGGAVYGSLTLGSMIGPVVGASLTETYSFQFATSMIGGCQLVLVITTALVLTIGRTCGKDKIDHWVKAA